VIEVRVGGELEIEIDEILDNTLQLNGDEEECDVNLSVIQKNLAVSTSNIPNIKQGTINEFLKVFIDSIIKSSTEI
jgi:hypothetical protein